MTRDQLDEHGYRRNPHHAGQGWWYEEKEGIRFYLLPVPCGPGLIRWSVIEAVLKRHKAAQKRKDKP